KKKTSSVSLFIISLNPFIALRDGSYPDSPTVSLIPDSHGSSPHTIIPISSEGAILIDFVLNVVRKEAENCDCLQDPYSTILVMVLAAPKTFLISGVIMVLGLCLYPFLTLVKENLS
ncbi:unnamed protein product, partial [Arabidopsis halleri]